MGQATGVVAGAAAGLAAGALAGAAMPPLAPVLAVVMAGVGAYAGSMAGAMATTRTPEEEKRETETSSPDYHAYDTRRGGMTLAVRVDPANEPIVFSVLRQAGVEDIERAEGQWQDGQWADFDPLQPPHKIDVETRTRN